MLRILEGIKEITLSSGRTVKIQKNGLGYYFRLLDTLLDSSTQDILKALEFFVARDDLISLSVRDLFEIINAVIEFNSSGETNKYLIDIEKLKSAPVKETKEERAARIKATRDRQDETAESLTIYLMVKLNMTKEYILNNLFYVDAVGICRLIDVERQKQLIDGAVAARGDLEKHLKSIRGMRGVTSADIVEDDVE